MCSHRTRDTSILCINTLNYSLIYCLLLNIVGAEQNVIEKNENIVGVRTQYNTIIEDDSISENLPSDGGTREILQELGSYDGKTVNNNSMKTDETVIGKFRLTKQGKNPFKNLFDSLPVIAPTSPGILNEACRNHSRIYVHQLKKYKLWALEMYDSTGKLPSGILKGNANQFGDFDQCLGIEANDGSHIKGKYCLMYVDIKAMPTDEICIDSLQEAVLRAESLRFIRSKYGDPKHFSPLFTTLNWGICVPASCTAEDVEQTLVEALQEYNETSGISFDIHIDEDMCYEKVNPKQSYGVATWCTILIFIGVICVTASGTVLDNNMEKTSNENKLRRYLKAFSLNRNINKLTSHLSEGDIGCVHGIRTITTLFIYYNHNQLSKTVMPFHNKSLFTQMSHFEWTILLRNGPLHTDVCLLMSGALTSFALCREMKRNNQFSWSEKLISRYIRFSPALIALVIYYAYIMEHLGSGPQWNRIVKPNADICKEKLWQNIFYLQGFFNLEDICAPHTHHLALDMRFSLLSPLLVTALWKWTTTSTIFMLCLCLLAAILRYSIYYHNQLFLVAYHGMEVEKMFLTANLSYCKMLHRISPYFSGVVIGYFLQRTGRSFNLPKIFSGGGWMLAACLIYYTFMSRYYMGYADYVYDAHDQAMFAALSPLLLPLGVGWVIWACYTGNGGFINKFLSARIFVLFSRICYAIYLWQFAVFYYNAGVKRYASELSFHTAIDIPEFLTVVVLSIIVTLLFDLPFQEIKNIIMEKKKDLKIAGADQQECNKNKEI